MRRLLLAFSAQTLSRKGRATNAIRGIIVPRQLKAYAGTFSNSIGERFDHLAGDLALQSLSPSRMQNSPLTGLVKTKMIDNFSDMLLAPELRKALEAMQITTPSPIQQTGIECILQRKNTLLGAPHGEGKTLAYLLPLYQNMMKDRDVYKIPLRERRPRMMLLAPTKELIEQLHGVCKKLDEVTGLTSASFTSRKRAKYHLSRLLKDTMPDVLIIDPKVILRLIRTRRIFLDDLRYVAVDEADAMLSSQHDHDAVVLLMKIQKRVMYKHLWPVQTQFVFASAYITRKLEHVVGKKFPDTIPCMFRQGMHRPPGTLRHRFHLVSQESDKLSVLLYLLRKYEHEPRPIRTDEEEIKAQTEPHKLSGTLEEYRIKRRAALQARIRTAPTATADRGSDHSDNSSGIKRSKKKEKEDLALDRVGGVLDRYTSDASSVSSSMGGGKGLGEATEPSTTAANDVSALPLANVAGSEANRPDHGAADGMSYAEDFPSRVALEQIRPIHWEHLSTVAAPFTCPIPRAVFAPGRRMIVFFRQIDAATAIFHQLRALGYAVSLLHASLPWAVRRESFADFASGRTNVLCATDLAARGLDLPVGVVVNFDMPTGALVYLGRAGRAARMGRAGTVHSLFRRPQAPLAAAVRVFLRKSVPLSGLGGPDRADRARPRYAEWRRHRIDALARGFVSLLTSRVIPAWAERTVLRQSATWRPVFHPQTTSAHGGVPPRQQHRLMEGVIADAVRFRREQLARRKGGRAKFGHRAAARGVWNDIGGVALRAAAGDLPPAPTGPPAGPPT